ncbi:hypothetical protein COO60DRAFT_391349 [Scenedesmus sp. NREL 46B-D3]|nr:hypothetical protein COO60DRAFT_391349 [Scenedesmus sp. NREL 46B-D3]
MGTVASLVSLPPAAPAPAASLQFCLTTAAHVARRIWMLHVPQNLLSQHGSTADHAAPWQQQQQTQTLLFMQVLGLANTFELDLLNSLDICERLPIVVPRCAIQIRQCCLSGVDAAAAACMIGIGGLFRLDASAAADSSLIEFESIFDYVGDQADSAIPSAPAITRAEFLHRQANDALAAANWHARAAHCWYTYSNKSEQFAGCCSCSCCSCSCTCEGCFFAC